MAVIHAQALDRATRSVSGDGIGASLRGRALKEHISAPAVNGNFSELFRLFVIAAAHEVINSVVPFTYSEYDPVDIRERAFNLIRSFKRLEMLSVVAQRRAGICAHEHFTEEEWLRLGASVTLAPLVSDRRYVVNSQAVRELGLEEVHSFQTALFSFASSVESQPDSLRDVLKVNFPKAIRFGKLLSNTLEKLMAGSLDIEGELEKKPVGNLHVLSVNLVRSCGLSVTETSGLPIDVYARIASFHPMFLAIIVSNISSNSKRAMELSGADQPIKLSTTVQDSRVCFEFSDSGCGMSKDIMASLNPGVVVSTKSKSDISEEQHGVGFAYCRLLAEKMGGQLYVAESHTEGPQRGSKIVLELPLELG